MWHDIRGHDKTVEFFRQSIERDRLASTYLFVGPAGIGKRSFALRLAQSLFCQTMEERALSFCGQCESCRLFAAGNHPDLLLVNKPETRAFIPVELLIGKDERRMKEGLCHDIAMKPILGRRRIAIVDDADYFNREGANALLKTLEEPPPGALILLIGTSASRQLPTIRSRCQIVRFGALATDEIARLLLAEGSVAESSAASRLAAGAGGSLQRARILADEQLNEFRQRLFTALANPPLDSIALAAAVNAIVDAAGREGAAKRDRLRYVISLVIEFYREVLRIVELGETTAEDPQIASHAVRCAEAWQGDLFSLLGSLERCFSALWHVDRNANQTTLVASWLDDMEELAAGGQAVL